MALKLKSETPEIPEDNPIDTDIELEVYKLQCKQIRMNSLLRFFLLVLSMAVAGTLGIIYNGDFLSYSFIFLGIIVTYAVGGKTEEIKEFLGGLIKK